MPLTTHWSISTLLLDKKGRLFFLYANADQVVSSAAFEVELKKLLRTAQVYFPALVNAKFAFMRLLRNALKVPFEDDFNALAFFPEMENALYLDVGANRGQSTDAILMKRKNARICLFEPNELLFEKLQDMFGDDERIVMHNFGFGDETTDGVLVVPYYRGWMFDGLASFDREAAGGCIPRSIPIPQTDRSAIARAESAYAPAAGRTKNCTIS